MIALCTEKRLIHAYEFIDLVNIYVLSERKCGNQLQEPQASGNEIGKAKPTKESVFLLAAG